MSHPWPIPSLMTIGGKTFRYKKTNAFPSPDELARLALDIHAAQARLHNASERADMLNRELKRAAAEARETEADLEHARRTFALRAEGFELVECEQGEGEGGVGLAARAAQGQLGAGRLPFSARAQEASKGDG